MSAERLYPIRPPFGNCREYHTRYHPGVLADDSQVLMKPVGDFIYGLWFTPEGWLCEARVRFFGPYRRENPAEVRFQVWARGVFGWQDEIGFQPGLIRVRKFSITRPVLVSIGDYRDWLEASGDFEPLEEGDEEKFVLYWETDYILDGEGTPAG